MDKYSRRSVLRGSLGLAAAAALSKPHIANAAATTATVWVNQGFVKAEDEAFKQLAADYMKASGNKLELQHHAVHGAEPEDDLRADQRRRAGPDLHGRARRPSLPQNAWDDKLVDVSDVVEPYEVAAFEDCEAECSTFYNKADKKRTLLPVPDQAGLRPVPHLGRPGREGRLQDVRTRRRPGTRSGTSSSRCRRSSAARACARSTRCGLQITTVGPNDGNGLFRHFLIANGGEDIVTPDGKLHTDDPKVREAAIKSVEFMTNLYKEGYVPPEALSWNDADDNNAYHEKLFVMDLDGTLSTELAMIKDKKAFYHDMKTHGPAERE